MKFALIILAFPTIIVFLLTAAMVRSAQQRYRSQKIERGVFIGQVATAAALWGSLVLLGGALMSGFGVAVKSPLIILALALLVAVVVFARLSKGVLWGKA